MSIENHKKLKNTVDSLSTNIDGSTQAIDITSVFSVEQLEELRTELSDYEIQRLCKVLSAEEVRCLKIELWRDSTGNESRRLLNNFECQFRGSQFRRGKYRATPHKRSREVDRVCNDTDFDFEGWFILTLIQDEILDFMKDMRGSVFMNTFTKPLTEKQRSYYSQLISQLDAIAMRKLLMQLRIYLILREGGFSANDL